MMREERYFITLSWRIHRKPSAKISKNNEGENIERLKLENASFPESSLANTNFP
jgi:hypothetical protein